MNSSTGTLLSDLIDVTDLVTEDRDRPMHELIGRDHEYGQSRDFTGKSSIRDIRSWINFRRNEVQNGELDKQTTGKGEQFAGTRALLTTVLVVLGIIFGWLAALALLRYDGSQPVNIMWLILVFVIAQLALVGLFLITLLPSRITTRLPLISNLCASIEAASPGNMVIALVRLLPQRHRIAVDRLLGSTQRNSHRFGSVARWLVLCWSQLFSLAFMVGAIAGSFILIVFTDLSFGWGTTLIESGSTSFYKLVSALSWPWSGFVEAAVPGQSLVESTRFRLSTSTTGEVPLMGSSAQDIGQSWWPFLIMAMITYGLLPRMFTAYLANRRLKQEITGALLAQPGVSEVLDRMTARRVATQSPTPETPTQQLDHHELAPAEGAILAGNAAVINWSNVPLSDDAMATYVQHSLLTNVLSVEAAGGSQSIEQDFQLVESVGLLDGAPTIVIVVKSWETPMLEFLDFLRDIRSAIGVQPTIVVLAIAAENNTVVVADSQHLKIWEERLQTIGDAKLRFGHAETATHSDDR